MPTILELRNELFGCQRNIDHITGQAELLPDDETFQQFCLDLISEQLLLAAILAGAIEELTNGR